MRRYQSIDSMIDEEAEEKSLRGKCGGKQTTGEMEGIYRKWFAGKGAVREKVPRWKVASN